MVSEQLRQLYRETRVLVLRELSDDELTWELSAVCTELEARRGLVGADDALARAALEARVAGADDALARAALEARARAASTARRAAERAATAYGEDGPCAPGCPQCERDCDGIDAAARRRRA